MSTRKVAKFENHRPKWFQELKGNTVHRLLTPRLRSSASRLQKCCQVDSCFKYASCNRCIIRASTGGPDTGIKISDSQPWLLIKIIWDTLQRCTNAGVQAATFFSFFNFSSESNMQPDWEPLGEVISLILSSSDFEALEYWSEPVLLWCTGYFDSVYDFYFILAIIFWFLYYSFFFFLMLLSYSVAKHFNAVVS